MAAGCDVYLHNWGLDSTFWIHRKIFVKEIHELKESKVLKGVYQCGNHMVLRVEVLGTIVCVDEREKLVVYGGADLDETSCKFEFCVAELENPVMSTKLSLVRFHGGFIGVEVSSGVCGVAVDKVQINILDDGTGIISCCYWKENTPRVEVYCLGQLVTVQGKVSTFRDQRQLTLNSIALEENPNAEVLFWLDAVKLNTEVYGTPFIIPAVVSHGESSTHSQQLMQFLRKSSQESGDYGFLFTDLYPKSRVQEIAQSIVDSKWNEHDQSNNTRSLSEGNKVVRQMLSQLEIQGEIYYKDAALDSYQIITHEHHLKPTIVKAIKDISKGSPHEGAHIARITDVLRSTQSLCRVSSGRVLDSLNKLICDSEIYQQTGQVYCIV